MNYVSCDFPWSLYAILHLFPIHRLPAKALKALSVRMIRFRLPNDRKLYAKTNDFCRVICSLKNILDPKRLLLRNVP